MRSWPLFALLACSCAAEVDVRDPSRAPVASIVSPAPGLLLRSGSYGLVGQVSDVDDDILHLVATWSVHDSTGWRVACRSYPEPDGTTRCLTDLTDDDDAISLLAVDLAGYQDEVSQGIEVVAASPPVITWEAPTAATGPFYRDVPVPVDAVVRDEDDPPSTWTLVWHSSLQGALDGPTAADAQGRVRGSLSLVEGTHTLRFTVRDPLGAEGSVERTIAVGGDNQAPSCKFVGPSDGAVADVSETWSLRGFANDPDVPSARLTVTFASDRDGALGSVSPDDAGQAVLDGVTLSHGSHTLSLTATDEAGLSCVAALDVVVGNRPLLTVSSPADGATATYGQPLHVTGHVDDPDRAVDGALVVSVVSNRTGLAGQASANDQGDFHAVVSLGGGAQTLTIEAVDASGLAASTTRNVTVVLPSDSGSP